MSITRNLLIFCSVLIAWSVTSIAQAQTQADMIEAIRDQINANRKGLVAENLDLSEEESAGFWPLYREYHHEMDLLMDRRMAMMIDFRDNFDDLSDEKSRQIIEDYFRLQEDALNVKKKYAKKFGKVLSDKRTLRYFQIENKMDAIVNSELTQIAPLAE